ncbi:hypothetical protein ACFQBQ_16365 [Granulicella cerasi]|uniref:Peptidase S9 prolyl oligopeptidase catalytic domain-containing protein n=1 Tax=Granulicella cerasi TaxID=741063 RepID=A0ABW1ZDD3_9BACT|nr:hypothetical protein [Granulicella cerasi]
MNTLAFLFLCAQSLNAQKHRFTVRDSIEMVTISDPAQVVQHPEVNFSPDGSKFLVVTTRGIVATSQIESDLLVYDVAEVTRYLTSSAVAQPPRPQHLATIRGTHRLLVDRPYAAVIAALRWSPDSRTVYFLGSDASGVRTLYRVGLQDPAPRAMNPKGVDVRSFELGSHHEVYFFGERIDEVARSTSELNGVPLYGSSRVVTGIPLQQLLFPQLENGMRPRRDSLWKADGRSAPKLIADANRLGGPSADNLSARTLAISPDSRHAVWLAPVSSIPSSWKDYDPLPMFEHLRFREGDAKQTSSFNYWRTRAYSIVDLRSGRSRPLLDAPSANGFGYSDKAVAMWSPDGTNVLVTNTFVPLSREDRSGRGHLPCVALSIEIATGSRQCLALTRDVQSRVNGEAQIPMHLISARYDRSVTNSILLVFARNGSKELIEERYVNGTKGWQKVSEVFHASAAQPLFVSVHQAMNQPPTLWVQKAEAPSDGSAKLLLDPNPQLRHVALGQARVYRWTDSSGRKWEGGLVLPVDYDPSHRYPLVIQTHGFAPHVFLADGWYPTAMAAFPLASAGIAVLQLGSNADHFVTPLELGDQLLGYQSAINHLVQDGIVDRQRVGIIGFSRTAWHVEGALVRDPRLFAAATIADGVDVSYTQYMLFGESNAGLAGEFDRINGAAPFGEGLHQWMDTAVGFELSKVKTPLRIETIGKMSLLGEWETYSSLRQQRKPVDLVFIPDGQHILQNPADRMSSQEGNVAWFCFWLLDRSESGHCPTVPAEEKLAWERMRDDQIHSSVLRTHTGTP